MTPYLDQLIKQAGGHTTYDYATHAKSRNYSPGKSNVHPKAVRQETGVMEKAAPKPTPMQLGVPARGGNRVLSARSAPFPTFLHSFSPTVSGTGYGRQYWSYKDNPFMS